MAKEDLRVIRTRKLLSKALKDLLQEKSFDKITVNDVCDKAMVHRATFYNHFVDKIDLLDYVFDEMQSEIYQNVVKLTNFNSSKEMYIANTTGTSSTDRIEGMIKNAVYGIIAAKACGKKNPSVHCVRNCIR